MIAPARRAIDVSEYYFSRKLAEVRELDSPELRVINLGIGSPDLAPSSDTIEALVDSARRVDSHAYQSYRGVPQLRRAIARFQRELFGVELDHEREILPLMGSKEGILHISMAFVDEGDEVLIPDPGYPTYASVAKLVGGVVRCWQFREKCDRGIDLDALAREDLTRVKLMWINFPHMPTGRVAARGDLEHLVEIARRNRFLLVNDNPYAMIGRERPLSLLSIDGAREVALELGSLSKSHNMAGWRVGWVAGRSEHIDTVLRVRSNMDSGMFLPLQLAAAKALESRGNWFDELNATYEERRQQANEILRTLDCTFADEQAGLFAWAKVPDSVGNVEMWLDEILNDTKVFITPGFVFGKAGERFIRVSLCSPVEVMREARERIATWRSHAGSQSGGAALAATLATCISDSERTDPQLAVRNTRHSVVIVGLGLIGGSIATDLRRSGLASRIVGIDANPEHAETALRRGIVDEIGAIETSLAHSDVIILAIPVDDIERLAPSILDSVSDDAVVIDTGSTKRSICEAIEHHPRRSQFVAAHPIAGTENSGPEAAMSDLFRGKVNIFCERERSSGRALATADEIIATLGMRSVFMEPREHDRHLAYVSHLSHITSFVLGQTVLDIEHDEKNIFLLAGSGLASTVRLAKSSPAMWAPIFDRNSSFLTKALDEYIAHLQRFRDALASGDVDCLRRIMTEANDIRRVLSSMEEPRSDVRPPLGLAAQAHAIGLPALLSTGETS